MSVDQSHDDDHGKKADGVFRTIVRQFHAGLFHSLYDTFPTAWFFTAPFSCLIITAFSTSGPPYASLDLFDDQPLHKHKLGILITHRAQTSNIHGRLRLTEYLLNGITLRRTLVNLLGINQIEDSSQTQETNKDNAGIVHGHHSDR